MNAEDIRKIKNEILRGKNINLRIATERDAAFILELRLNETLNKFIGKTDPSEEVQKKWIQKAYERNNDFHFIIEDKNSNPFGTVALYNINFETGVAEWGRWVMKPNVAVYFSVESMILILWFAFRKIGLKKLEGGANNKNVPVVNFHKMYAAVTHVDETHTFFTFDDANFLKALRIFKKFHSINF